MHRPPQVRCTTQGCGCTYLTDCDTTFSAFVCVALLQSCASVDDHLQFHVKDIVFTRAHKSHLFHCPSITLLLSSTCCKAYFSLWFVCILVHIFPLLFHNSRPPSSLVYLLVFFLFVCMRLFMYISSLVCNQQGTLRSWRSSRRAPCGHAWGSPSMVNRCGFWSTFSWIHSAT
jgi:hypothetical protein